MDHRYPISAELQYKVKHLGVTEDGRGITLNLSSRGVLFRTARELAPGLDIELSIAWPARLGGVTRLRLHVTGRTVRRQNGCTAVTIVRYEYRTSGAADLKSMANNPGRQE